ncbi:MAG: DUF116 domain-containing protein [Desulfovibrio sp.]|jgi:hypothetical protein|nr:DUF116 domain-containing protein [Desulfovibrio sp.]
MLTKLMGSAGAFFFPLFELLAPLFGLSRVEARRVYIRRNNTLVLGSCGRFAPGRMLVLVPHCLQQSGCRLRLTFALDRCARCGSCPIAALLALRDAYGPDMEIATGGGIARRLVEERRPEIILAVACERDLSSGIRDTYPLPVFGILNDRPQGDCVNTSVPVELLESALRRFIVAEKLPPLPLFAPSEAVLTRVP